MALNVLGHLSREVADIGADRDLAVRRQEEVAVAREEGAREIEKALQAVEEQLQTVEVDCVCFQSQVSELKNMLAHKDSLLVQKDKLIQTMEHDLRFARLEMQTVEEPPYFDPKNRVWTLNQSTKHEREREMSPPSMAISPLFTSISSPQTGGEANFLLLFLWPSISQSTRSLGILILKRMCREPGCWSCPCTAQPI